MTIVMAIIGVFLFAWIFAMGLQAVMKRYSNAPERFIYTNYIDSDGVQRPFVIDVRDIGNAHD